MAPGWEIRGQVRVGDPDDVGVRALGYGELGTGGDLVPNTERVPGGTRLPGRRSGRLEAGVLVTRVRPAGTCCCSWFSWPYGSADRDPPAPFDRTTSWPHGAQKHRAHMLYRPLEHIRRISVLQMWSVVGDLTGMGRRLPTRRLDGDGVVGVVDEVADAVFAAAPTGSSTGSTTRPGSSPSSTSITAAICCIERSLAILTEDLPGEAHPASSAAPFSLSRADI